MKKRILAGILAMTLVLSLCACGGETVENQPSGQVEQSENTADVPVSEDPQSAYGYNGVVAAADPVAAKVGLQVLKDGGNAADAAVATAFALALTENAASGIGSSGFMVYYDAATKETKALNYYFQCPAAMTLDDFKNATKTRDEGMGGLRAVVPGFVAGMCKINELFGTMELADLIAPTITLAEEGVEVSAFMAETYRDYYERILLYPETARIFTDDGFPYGEGSTFTNPDLAKTLRIISEKGRDGFYKGEIAEAVVDSQRATGSKMTLEDLEAYEVTVAEPISSTYRGYKVVTMPPPCGGGIVLSSLNLAEHFDIGSMDRNSTEYLHTWGEIFHLSMADFTTYFEDPAFHDVSGVYGLITKEYADDRVKLISSTSTMDVGPVGDAPSYDPENHTTHLSIIDKDGNMVSMTNTYGDFFGTLTTVTDYGFVIEDTGSFAANNSKYYPEPGKRARSPMSPTMIFYEDGTPFAAVGTPGSNRIMATIPLIISNLIDYNMELKTAVDAPRLYQARNGALTLEGGFDEGLVSKLEALGHDVTVRVANDSFFGGAHCIAVDKDTGLKSGAADIRRSGVAVAY